jgi:hypothetical protein
MVSKMKEKLQPMDYSLNMFRKLQIPRKKIKKNMKEYTQEFYGFSIRSRQSDETIIRYINGLKYSICNDITLL